MATTATVLIGTDNLYSEDISATHLARLVEGDRAVWVLTDLTSGEVARWFPHRPERIGPDLWAFITTHVIGAPNAPAALTGPVVRPSGDVDADLDTIGGVTRSHPNVVLLVTTLGSSTLASQRQAIATVPAGGANVLWAATAQSQIS